MNKLSYIPEGKTYLDTARDGLLSKENFNKISKIRLDSWQNLTDARDYFLAEGIKKIRNSAARFINCKESEVCLVNSFSAGFNFILPSLAPWKKVLILENDYPSIFIPLGLREFEIHEVKPDENKAFHVDRIISEAETFKPEIIAVSHVQYTTGFKCEIALLGEYCHANNIIFIVDATQSLGCVPIDLTALKIDILAASTYKWMCAGHGAGILYVNEKLQEKISIKVGYYGTFVEFGSAWKSNQNIRNFEAGHKDHDAFYRLGFALEDMIEKDMNSVLEHNRSLILKMKMMFLSADYELISDYSKNNLAGILVVKDHQNLAKRLEDQNIIFTKRTGNMRLSCHFYNNESDLEKLSDVL